MGESKISQASGHVGMLKNGVGGTWKVQRGVGKGTEGANLCFSQGAWEVSYGPPEIMETIITNVC